MRPKPSAVLVVLGLALALAGQAVAANGGLTPVTPHSPSAHRINDSYYLILGFTGGVFVLVEAALILFAVRFRSRGRARHVEGPQIRGNTRLETAWTLAPVLVLAAIAAFVFYKLPGIKDVPEARAGGTLPVRVEAHQFYWQFEYPGGQIAIDRMVVPVNRIVTLDVVSPDVAHSWWIPALGGKIDAIPGRTNRTWFRASRPGVYTGRCAELCGIEHAHMTASVEVVTADEFRRFLAAHRPSSATVATETFDGVCAKCHGLQGQGGIGPRLRGNPLLADARGTEQLLREGRRTGFRIMPAVGKDWSGAQMRTVLSYLKRNLASTGGAQSGG